MDIVDPKEMNFDEKELKEIKARYGPGYKLLGPDDTFKFTCSRCTRCCKNRSDYHCFDKIIMVPYDIIRISRRLKITTTEFLSQYAEIEERQRVQSREVILKFKGDDTANICPFLSDSECSVYDDRPMSCRLYPLGRVIFGDKAVIFMPEAQKDCALGTGQKHVVSDWLENSGLTHYFKYDRPWELFRKIDPEKFDKLPPNDRDFFFRSMYDMDSGGILLKKNRKLMSPEETTLAIYNFCEFILEKFGCLKPKGQE